MRYLVFLDESGTPEAPLKMWNRYYLLTAFIIPSHEMNDLYRIHRLIIDFAKEKYDLTIEQELKGKKIFDDFAKRNPENKHSYGSEYYTRFIEDIFSIYVFMLNFDLIIYVIDKEKLDKFLLNFIEKLKCIDSNDIPNYLNILKQKRYIDKIFDLLKDDLINQMRKYVYPMQLVNEVILRTDKIMKEKSMEKNEEVSAYLFFDAEAKTIMKSLYSLISEKILSKKNVPYKDGLIPIQNIETYFLVDSKLNPGIQIADIISYSIHRLLTYEDNRKYFLRVAKDIFFIGKSLDSIWGRKIKVIPWTKEEFKEIFKE